MAFVRGVHVAVPHPQLETVQYRQSSENRGADQAMVAAAAHPGNLMRDMHPCLAGEHLSAGHPVIAGLREPGLLYREHIRVLHRPRRERHPVVKVFNVSEQIPGNKAYRTHGCAIGGRQGVNGNRSIPIVEASAPRRSTVRYARHGMERHMSKATWRDHTARLIAMLMLHNEANDMAKHLRAQILTEGTDYLTGGLTATTLPQPMRNLLTGDSYYSVPYVWNLLRSRRVSPVPVQRLWREVHARWTEADAPTHTGGEELPEHPGRQVFAILERTISLWEQAITPAWGAPIAVAVILDPRQDHLRFMHHFDVEFPHPLTDTLRQHTWPLPVWHHPHKHGELLVAIVPDQVAEQLGAYTSLRTLPGHAEPVDVDLDTVATQDLDALAVMLHLLAGAGFDARHTVHAAVTAVHRYARPR